MARRDESEDAKQQVQEEPRLRSFVGEPLPDPCRYPRPRHQQTRERGSAGLGSQDQAFPNPAAYGVARRRWRSHSMPRASGDVHVVHTDESVVEGAAPIPKHLVRCSYFVSGWDLLRVVTLKVWIIDKEVVAVSEIAIGRDEVAYETAGQWRVGSSAEVAVANGHDHRLIPVDVIPDGLKLLRRGEVSGVADRRCDPVGFQQVADVLNERVAKHPNSEAGSRRKAE